MIIINTKFTTIELKNIKIALGLNDNNQIINRNFFFCQKPCATWEGLIKKGYATVKDISGHGIIYTVTQHGINTYINNI